MRALLEAIEEGRLIELPENDKQKAITVLASLVEAVPSVHPDARIVEDALAREAQAGTYLGAGWAIPHARTPHEGEMLCAVGWSPTGIAYGNADGIPVRVILLYYVPDAHRGGYLKEVSALARMLKEESAVRDISHAATLSDVRSRLLDVVAGALQTGQAEARARMIRLETRAAQAAVPVFDPAMIVPAWIVVTPDGRATVLARDEEVVRALESHPDLGAQLEKQPLATSGSYVIHVRQSSAYGLGRGMYDCLVVKPPRSTGTGR